MAKDLNTTGRWLKRLTQGLATEPQDREQLLAVLREAGERGLLDADAVTMLEGVLGVADLQVRDIMVPRGQMVVVRLYPGGADSRGGDPSGHSRYPVMDEDRDDIVGILMAKDPLPTPGQQRAALRHPRVHAAVAQFVPESKRLERAVEGIPP